MALPTSGNITIAMIAAELGVGLPLDLNAANVRTLAGKPTGSVIMPTDFYGKSGNFAGPIIIDTNDPSGSGFTTHQIAGYSGNRSLRVERYNYTGDTTFSQLIVTVSTGGSKTGPWSVRGSFNPMLGGLQYVDFTAATGQWIKYEVSAATGYGRKAGNFSMVIWDLTAGVQISPDKPVSVVVDADNNYVPAGTITGSIDERFVRNDGWDEWWRNEGNLTANASSGTPTAYAWSIQDTGDGTMTLFIQGAANQRNVTLVSNDWTYNMAQERTVKVNCNMTIGGVVQGITQNMTYYGG